jgi:hypothetical protein
MVLYVKAKLSTTNGEWVRVWRDGMQTNRLISREKNLQAALDLIVNQGYYGTSIKGITARVGISNALYTFEHKVWIGTVGIVAIFHVYIQRTEQRP